MKTVFYNFTEELIEVRHLISSCLEREIPKYAKRLLESFPLDNGRGLRPSLLLASAGEQALRQKRDALHRAAAAVEIVHAGSLLHDDIVDEATLRRHKPTINTVYGAREAVLLGDYFLSRAFRLVLSLQSSRATSSFVRLMETMVEGEFFELEKSSVSDYSERDALKIIEKKTGSLFAEACFIGGLISGLPKEDLENLREFGFQSGLVYQLADDVLDTTSLSGNIGKDTGVDFLHGRPTLPLVYALEIAPKNSREEFQNAKERSKETSTAIMEVMKSPAVKDRICEKARDSRKRAVQVLTGLKDLQIRRDLEEFANYAYDRTKKACFG